MQVFYTTQMTDTEAWLDEEEMQHCTRTLRKREGDCIQVMDGKGKLYDAYIVEINKRQVRLRLGVLHPAPPPRPYRLHIAIAPTKNIDRIEFFLEKATEIGIDEVSFLRCQRSERREVRLDRLEKIVLSAAKQSLQLHLPKINEMLDFKEFIHKNKASNSFIAHCQQSPLPLLLHQCARNSPATVLIGPEGDFSNEEIELALQAGYQAISLGESRLRTETAALVACMQVSVLHQI